jgi:hypothetical protein
MGGTLLQITMKPAKLATSLSQTPAIDSHIVLRTDRIILIYT